MGLRINTNVSALTSHRALSNTDSRLSKNLERLSTGLRINTAADDAAGLTISEKLRTQIRGLSRASLNIQDGISLIQTAEGALDQVQSMLQRMRELAIQSANDTLTTSDRLEIQKEVEQLKDQVDQVANTTEFNTKKLLDGSSTAVMSSNAPFNLTGIPVGSISGFGDYSITVEANGENAGKNQKQRSNIFTRTDGAVASIGTTLQSIRQFTDNSNNFILQAPQELYLIADNIQTHFTVSKDLTLGQLADRMSIGVNEGLGITNTTTKITTGDDVTKGAIEIKSGKVGRIGEINLTGSDDLIKALGFEITQSSVDAVYTVKSTQLDQTTVNTVSTKIAGNRAANLIQGIDLQFEPGRTASISGSITAIHGISIDSTENMEFHVVDTDGTSIGIVLYNNTATMTLNGTTITAPATGIKGRYTIPQVVSFFNQAASTNYTDNTASIHHFLATKSPSTLNVSAAFGVAGTASFFYGIGNLNLSIGSGAVRTQVNLTQHFESAASVATAINSSLVAAGVLVSVGTNGNKLRFYQKAGATAISIMNIAGGGQNDGVADINNLRKLGFSFAAANITTTSSFVQTSFALQSYDYSSIANAKGMLSFAISQTGSPVNIVIRENVGSIGGLVNTINNQLIQANSGVRASQVGGVLQFYTATGPELFQVQDLGLAATGLFSSGTGIAAYPDTRNLLKLHLSDATNHTSNAPTIFKTPRGGDSNFSIRAALNNDGNISFYYQSEKGSASKITVSVRSGGQTNKLGITNGTTTGVGGVQAIATATTAVKTVKFGDGGANAGSIVLFVSDQEYDATALDNFTRLSFSGNGTYDMTVLKNVFNNQLAQQDSDIRVSIGASGNLNFYTRGGGAVAKVTVREMTVAEGRPSTGGQDVSLAQLGFTVTNGIPATGFPSSVAVNFVATAGADSNGAKGPSVNGVVTKANRIYGYQIGDFNTGAGDALRIKISDGAKTSGIISIPEGELSWGTAFYKGSEIASIFETALNATSIGVNAVFNLEERIFTLTTDNIGDASKIQILETSPGSNTMKGLFGINPDSYSGVGETKFKLHVKDTAIKFQIGANEKQQVTSNIIRTDTTALNIGKVDLTNIKSATDAITLIDHALDILSSERAKLGAIQNRMEYTKASVDIANENLTSAESRIRDVDFAREVIEQTRNQILLQSSTAQLAQANSVPQTVLQLLQG